MNDKEKMAVLKAALMKAMYAWTPIESRAAHKSEIMQSDLSLLGDEFGEDVEDLWIFDAEDRIQALKDQIMAISSARADFVAELDRREINWMRSKEVIQADKRLSKLGKQLLDMEEELDKRTAESGESKERDWDENPRLHLLRMQWLKAHRGIKDKGAWRWAKRSLQYATNATLSYKTELQIKIGCYLLFAELCKVRGYDGAESWLMSAEETKAKLEEYEGRYSIKHVEDQKYGLSVNEMEWAIECRRRNKKSSKPNLSYMDNEFVLAEQAKENEWLEPLFDVIGLND